MNCSQKAMNYLLLVCLLNKFKTIERIFIAGAGGSGQCDLPKF
jgi:hypothetical protein